MDNAYIGGALNDLVELLGIKEPPDTQHLRSLAASNRMEECATEIAKQLGLTLPPPNVSLSELF